MLRKKKMTALLIVVACGAPAVTASPAHATELPVLQVGADGERRCDLRLGTDDIVLYDAIVEEAAVISDDIQRELIRRYPQFSHDVAAYERGRLSKEEFGVRHAAALTRLGLDSREYIHFLPGAAMEHWHETNPMALQRLRVEYQRRNPLDGADVADLINTGVPLPYAVMSVLTLDYFQVDFISGFGMEIYSETATKILDDVVKNNHPDFMWKVETLNMIAGPARALWCKILAQEKSAEADPAAHEHRQRVRDKMLRKISERGGS